MTYVSALEVASCRVFESVGHVVVHRALVDIKFVQFRVNNNNTPEITNTLLFSVNSLRSKISILMARLAHLNSIADPMAFCPKKGMAYVTIHSLT